MICDVLKEKLEYGNTRPAMVSMYSYDEESSLTINL